MADYTDDLDSVRRASPGYGYNQLRLDPTGRLAANRAADAAAVTERFGQRAAAGDAMRAAAPKDYSEFAARSAANQGASQSATRAAFEGTTRDYGELAERTGSTPKPAPSVSPSGAALRNQPPKDYGDLQQRLSTPSEATRAPSVAPRAVPIGQPGGVTAGAPNTLYVNSAGTATQAINPNTRGASAMSAEAQEFLRARAASAAPAVAPAAAEAAPAAAPAAAEAAAPKTMAGVARTLPALGAAARAVAPAIEGVQVADVAMDPRMSKGDLIDQGATGAGRLMSAAAGARLGAMAGGLAGPWGAAIGGVAGGVGGYMLGDKGINDIRAAIGLGPKTPFERLQDMRAADQPSAQPGQPPAQAPATRASDAQATPKPSLPTVTPAASRPTTPGSAMAAAAAPAVKANRYELGKNAVEVIQPGVGQHVETFGQNEHGMAVPEGAVPSSVFRDGQVDQYRSAMAKAGMEAISDPGHKLAERQLANDGELGKARIMANAPHVVAPRPNPLAGTPGQPAETEGFVVTPNDGGPARVQPLGNNVPPRAKAIAQATAALRAKKTTPEDAASIMAGYGYGGTFAKQKDGSFLYIEPKQ